MTIRFRDTLTGETRPFAPLRDDVVGIYSCGPTVYGPAHIGNFRSFLFADLLVRHLRWRGFTVRWVMNITDIDDKIIRGAAAEGVGIAALADRYLAGFLTDADALRMTRPDALPRATEHIDEIVVLIETLLERGHAYRTDDGSIFFRIASWPAYGTLARLDPEQLRVGERVESDEYGKDDVRDFALWKGPKADEPSWDTAIGPGRPGWHIECSAMSMAELGPSFDIHTGGVDLIFPHHEDEIAQSEAATGQAFVGTWLHCAHLQQDGSKMAKSTGNIARVGELLGAGISPRALRYALIAVHYRASLNHSGDSLAAAGAALGRIDAFAAALVAYAEDAPDDPTLGDALASARTAFGDAMDDDLNVSAALAALFDLVRDLNRRIEARSISSADAVRALDAAARPRPASWGSCPTMPMASRPTSRPSSTRDSPPARPRTGPNRTASATSSPTTGSRSRTPATGNAGGDSSRPVVADRPPDDGRPAEVAGRPTSRGAAHPAADHRARRRPPDRGHGPRDHRGPGRPRGTRNRAGIPRIRRPGTSRTSGSRPTRRPARRLARPMAGAATSGIRVRSPSAVPRPGPSGPPRPPAPHDERPSGPPRPPGPRPSGPRAYGPRPGPRPDQGGVPGMPVAPNDRGTSFGRPPYRDRGVHRGRSRYRPRPRWVREEELVAGRRPVEEAFVARRPAHPTARRAPAPRRPSRSSSCTRRACGSRSSRSRAAR